MIFLAKAKVYYTDARGGNYHLSLAHKVKELFYEAGLHEAIQPGDIVAIKIHVGEWNRTSCLRPELVAAVVECVKESGGRPFVTDTTTLSYHPWSSRYNAYYELLTAYRHGFTPDALGCPLIIADGFHGEDDVRVDLPEGIILKEAYIARMIAEADVLINLAHGKGHPVTSFGGCIKNIGIGAQSKRGKYQVHMALWGDPKDAIGWPSVDKTKCPGKECPYWQLCEQSCPEGAIKITEKGLEFDFDKCKFCWSCAVLCVLVAGKAAIGFPKPDYFPLNQIAMADAALGCAKTKKPGKLVNMMYLIDITPWCDCFPWGDIPIAPDIGILASKDVVAIDAAALDLVDKAPIVPWSRAEELGLKPGDDKFKAVNGFPPRVQVKAGEKIGLGTTDYELIEYKPELTPETVGKHQIQKTPTIPWLKRVYERKHILEGVLPFKRAKFGTVDWHVFE